MKEKRNSPQKNNSNKTKLSKEEIKALKARLNELENQGKNSTQSMIPYIEMTQDGICHIEGNKYSKTIRFSDINYLLSNLEQKDAIFSKYCDLLNFFDNSVHFQLTFENQSFNDKEQLKSLIIPQQDDDYNDIRQEYTNMITEKYSFGQNNKQIKKYITFTLKAENIKTARLRLNSIASEITSMLEGIGVEAEVLDGRQRLESLYNDLNPMTEKPFIFDWKYRSKVGASTKDFIAPNSIKWKKTSFDINDCCGSVFSISILAGNLPDNILDDYLSSDNLFSINMHVEPFDQVEALKFIKRKLTDVEQTKINEQKKAIRAGYDPDILPPDIKLYIDELTDMLDDLQSQNQRLFIITLTVRCLADNKSNLKKQQEFLKRITQKNNCQLVPLEYLQEEGLASSLPLGYNSVPINRVLITKALAVFMPFKSQEIFQGGNATYYGINACTGNLILADRKKLKNPNGLFLGTPGSGKSFAVKREILDRFLKTSSDIIICDPEGEYYPLVNRLNGQVIQISFNAQQHINPMDIVWDADIDEDPIAVKSDFLTSLLELIVGGQYGLLADEKSIVDRCIRQLYLRFLNNNPSQETMPVLADLLQELRQAGDMASRVANSLELYVTGSQNVFNHRTNVDMNNRVVCFDIKNLGTQLRKVGMLIIQDHVWNKVAKNRNKISTLYYIDEFHLLLREEQTAKYSVEMWKRFRKWGGQPTGITQNIKDLLMSQEIENIFENSDFIYMLNQAAGDREILGQKLHISDEQLEYVTNKGAGEGLIFYGDTILPFIDKFPKDTQMYRLLTTNPQDIKIMEEKVQFQMQE